MNMNKKPYLIDVAVAVNFFIRPDTLIKTLTSIRAARPSLLFLIADGPRDDVASDYEKCEACREIADKMIDWDCKVTKIYNERNKGLFDTYFDSMTQVFEKVDYCIFMEDDVVADVSFFRFCKEMLEMYKNDLRISFVTGINYMKDGVHNKVDSSYFFSGEGALQAYGLWKRTFERMNMNFLKSQYCIDASKKLAIKIKKGYEKRIEKYETNLMWQGHMPHVEVYKNLLRILENQICIVPVKNLVTNIGLGDESTHSANSINKIPKATWYVYTTPVYSLSFPLRHPDFMIADVDYEKRLEYLTAWNRPLLNIARRLEALFRHIIFGDLNRVIAKIKLVFTGKYVFDE